MTFPLFPLFNRLVISMAGNVIFNFNQYKNKNPNKLKENWA